MNVLWLLVGRGGSRGVVGKNLRVIAGHSLVSWKLAGALAADPSAYVVVSSDDAGIRGEAMDHGASAEIARPPELASDTATTASVVRHALGELRQRGLPGFDAVMLLECSSPFPTSQQYRDALRMMEERDADLIVGMRETSPHTAFIGDVRDDASVTGIIIQFQRMARRRQDFTPQWSMSGAMYLFKTKMFQETLDCYGGVKNFGLMQDRWTGLEIDSPSDLEMACYAAERGYVKYGA